MGLQYRGNRRAACIGVGLMLAAAQPAAAVVFNFDDMGAGNERYWDTGSGVGAADGSFDDAADTWTVGGIGLHAQGGGGPNARAFLDGPSGGLSAGLGVCNDPECEGTHDDNLGLVGGGLTGSNYETLTLTLSGAPGFRIEGVSFRDRLHNPLGASFSFLVNGQPATASNLPITGTVFSFGVDPAQADPMQRDFYVAKVIVSAIPVPPAALLLLSAVGALAHAARRSRRRPAG